MNTLRTLNSLSTRSKAALLTLALSGIGSQTALAADGWTLVDLGRASSASMPSMNDQGWVVFGNKVWAPGPNGYTLTELMSSAGNGNNFRLTDINNSNVIVGVDDSLKSGTGFTWQNGVRKDLPALANWNNDVYADVRGINDSGQIVGNTGDTAHLWTPNGSGGYQLTSLGVDLGWTIGSGDGVALNNGGDGLMSQVYNSYRTGYSRGVGHTTLIPEQSGYTPIGASINDQAQVIGIGVYDCGGFSCSRPFFWQGQEVSWLPVPLDPGSPGFGITGNARALNERLQVVGDAYYAAYDRRAYLWSRQSDGSWASTELNTLLPAGSSFYQLQAATDINEAGQIVGMGAVAGDDVVHAFLLTPSAVPEPHSAPMWLAGLGLVGWMLRRRARRAAAP